jgi:hypothetical protein
LNDFDTRRVPFRQKAVAKGFAARTTAIGFAVKTSRIHVTRLDCAIVAQPNASDSRECETSGNERSGLTQTHHGNRGASEFVLKACCCRKRGFVRRTNTLGHSLEVRKKEGLLGQPIGPATVTDRPIMAAFRHDQLFFDEHTENTHDLVHRAFGQCGEKRVAIDTLLASIHGRSKCIGMPKPRDTHVLRSRLNPKIALSDFVYDKSLGEPKVRREGVFHGQSWAARA